MDNRDDLRPIPVYVVPAEKMSDELGLSDLVRVAVKRRWVILLCLSLALLVAFVYLFRAEPLYKANAYLLRPQQQMIQGLLIEYRDGKAIDFSEYTPEFVYNAFLRNLNSRSLRHDFYKSFQNGGSNGQDALPVGDYGAHITEKTFDDQLVVQEDKKSTSAVMVSFSHSNPEDAALLLNRVIDFADRRTIQQLTDNVNAAIQSEIGQVRYQLEGKLKLAEQRRLDRIVTLKEAVRIAEALGLRDRSTYPKMDEKSQPGLAVNTAQVPLYMRGTEALRAEIVVLESRKSDESFIDGFRDLQERRAYLEQIKVDPDVLSAVTRDAIARVPSRSEKSQWALILCLSALLGAVAGLIAAFTIEFVSGRQK